ncbi:hypothetical protein BH23CHL8_BH23CHL8_21050 [soil metagenome]
MAGVGIDGELHLDRLCALARSDPVHRSLDVDHGDDVVLRAMEGPYRHLGAAGARSNEALRLLFSRVGRPHVGHSNAFSFNDPAGMCPECGGLGRKSGFVVDDLIDRTRSLDEGAITVLFWTGWEIGAYAAWRWA